MSEDRGGLNYPITVEDKFSDGFRAFIAATNEAKAAYSEFKTATGRTGRAPIAADDTKAQIAAARELTRAAKEQAAAERSAAQEKKAAARLRKEAAKEQADSVAAANKALEAERKATSDAAKEQARAKREAAALRKEAAAEQAAAAKAAAKKLADERKAADETLASANREKKSLAELAKLKRELAAQTKANAEAEAAAARKAAEARDKQIRAEQAALDRRERSTIAKNFQTLVAQEQQNAIEGPVQGPVDETLAGENREKRSLVELAKLRRELAAQTKANADATVAAAQKETEAREKQVAAEQAALDKQERKQAALTFQRLAALEAENAERAAASSGPIQGPLTAQQIAESNLTRQLGAVEIQKAEEELKRLRPEFAALRNDANTTGNSLFFTFRRLIGVFAAFAAVRAVVSGLKEIVSGSVEINANFEQTKLGVAALFVAVGDVRDATGRTVDATKALVLAQGEAGRQMRLLRNDALETGATFEELAQTFQVAIGPGLAAGLNVDDIRKFTVQISQAATAIGLQNNQLSEEIRSLLTGTIQQRTTRIAASLGITNEDIRNAKQAGNLAEFLNDRFKAFSIAGHESLNTFNVILSNLRDTFEQVLAQGSVGFFEEIKGLLKDIQNSITTRGDDGILRPRPEVVEAFKAIFASLQDIVGSIRSTVSLASEELAVVSKLKDQFSFLAPVLRVINQLVRISGDFMLGRFAAGVERTINLFKTLAAGIKSLFVDDAAPIAKVEPQQVLLADLGSQADKTAKSIDDVHEAFAKIGQSTGPKDSLFGASTQAAHEFADALKSAAQEEVDARAVLQGLLSRANNERFVEIKTIGQVRIAAERLNAAIRDRANLETEIARLVRARQLDEIRQQNVAGENALFQERLDLLRAQGREEAAILLQRQQRERTLEQEIAGLQRLFEKGSAEDRAIEGPISQRASQLLEANRLATQAEDVRLAEAARIESERRKTEDQQKANDLERLNVDLIREHTAAAQHDAEVTARQQQDELARLQQQAGLREQANSLEAERDSALADAQARHGFENEALQIRIGLVNQENERRKAALRAQTEALGIDEGTEASLQRQFETMDLIAKLKVEQLQEERAQDLASKRKEANGQTTTIGEAFKKGIDIDVLQSTIGEARSLVESFGQFTVQTLIDAFNPHEDLLNNLSSFLEKIGIQILEMLAQIAIAKLAILAIDAATAAFTGGASTAVGAGAGAIVGVAKGVAHFADGGAVPAIGSSIPRPSYIPASDTTPAWLTPGERVFSLPTVNHYGDDAMEALHQRKVPRDVLRLLVGLTSGAPRAASPRPAFSVPGMAVGGSVPNIQANSARGGGVAEAILVPNEQVAARLKAAGGNADLRWFRTNRTQVRAALGIRG